MAIVGGRRALDFIAQRGVPPASGPTTEAVVWTAIVGATVDAPNTLRKTNVGNWTAGAVSTKAITSGAGYVEVTAWENTTTRSAFGLGTDNASVSYTDIEFGLELRQGLLYCWESGGLGTLLGAYAISDVIRVAVSAAGVVTYLKNGALLRTSLVGASWPLVFDAALHGVAGAQLVGATISGALGASGF